MNQFMFGIGNWTLGRVVVGKRLVSDDNDQMLIHGHIIGFSENCFHEVLIHVKWQDGLETTIHPIHLTLL